MQNHYRQTVVNDAHSALRYLCQNIVNVTLITFLKFNCVCKWGQKNIKSELERNVSKYNRNEYLNDVTWTSESGSATTTSSVFIADDVICEMSRWSMKVFDIKTDPRALSDDNCSVATINIDISLAGVAFTTDVVLSSKVFESRLLRRRPVSFCESVKPAF